MQEIHIRPARLADAEAVAELAPSAEDMRQAAPREISPLDAEVVEHWMKERGSGFVLERGGEIFAYGELNENSQSPGMYWIGHVMVRPRHRGSGFGRTLVGALLKYAVQHYGARDVRISAFEDNPAAVRCYLACGFAESSRRKIEGRVLVDLRYEDQGGQRILPPLAAGLLVMGVVGLGALLLPDGSLLRLRQIAGAAAPFALLAGAMIAGVLGVLFHPVLPRRRGTGLERLLLPVIYGASVALGTALLTILALFVLARLGTGVGKELLQDPSGALGPMSSHSGMAWFWDLCSRALTLGAGGGLMLSLFSWFLERRR